MPATWAILVGTLTISKRVAIVIHLCSVCAGGNPSESAVARLVPTAGMITPAALTLPTTHAVIAANSHLVGVTADASPRAGFVARLMPAASTIPAATFAIATALAVREAPAHLESDSRRSLILLRKAPLQPCRLETHPLALNCWVGRLGRRHHGRRPQARRRPLRDKLLLTCHRHWWRGLRRRPCPPLRRLPANSLVRQPAHRGDHPNKEAVVMKEGEESVDEHVRERGRRARREGLMRRRGLVCVRGPQAAHDETRHAEEHSNEESVLEAVRVRPDAFDPHGHHEGDAREGAAVEDDHCIVLEL